LAFSLPEFLVCHNLLHPFFHGCQILEILKPAYSSYFAETVHVSTQLTTVFLSHPIGDLLCPLYRLWLFAWSNPCTSCPSNHVRTPFFDLPDFCRSLSPPFRDETLQCPTLWYHLSRQLYGHCSEKHTGVLLSDGSSLELTGGIGFTATSLLPDEIEQGRDNQEKQDYRKTCSHRGIVAFYAEYSWKECFSRRPPAGAAISSDPGGAGKR